MIGLYEEFEELLEEKNTINENDVDLYTWGMTHGEYGKQILEEWSTKNVGNFNEPLSPKEVYYKDIRKYWWHCSYCGSEYYSQLYKRVHNHRECPYCAHKRTGINETRHYAENGISVRNYTNMVCYGDIILKEWDEEANAEKGFTLDNVPYCSNKTAHWICSNCGKTYTKGVYFRVRLNQGCPDCGRAGTSLYEQFIYWSLKQLDSNTAHRIKVNGFEYDVYVPVWDLYIEYNGVYWHRNSLERDELKKSKVLINNSNFVRILVGRSISKDEYTPNEIRLREELADFELKIQKTIIYIVGLFNGDTSKINFKKAMESAYKHVFLPENNNILQKYPMLAEECLPCDNNGIGLDRYTCGSNFRVIWTCKNCGYKWETKIADRIRNKRGCKRCKFNIFKLMKQKE